MSKNFIFCHGFAFDSNFFENLLPLLSYNKVKHVELNFFKDDKPFFPELVDESSYIAVGHSLGFNMICKRYPFIQNFVGINAFSNFLGVEKKLYNLRYREYRFFKNSFLLDPEKTINNFYLRCALPKRKIPYINIKNCLESLEFLIEINKLSILKKYYILNSKNDVVVPYILSEDNFRSAKVELQYLDYGRHHLGNNNPEIVANLINGLNA